MGANSNPRKRKRILFAVLLTVSFVVFPFAYIVIQNVNLGTLGLLQTQMHGILLIGGIGFAVARGIKVSLPSGFWIAMGAALILVITLLILRSSGMGRNQELIFGFIAVIQIIFWIGLIAMIIQAIRGRDSATISFEEGIEELKDKGTAEDSGETSVPENPDTADIIAKIRGNKSPK